MTGRMPPRKAPKNTSATDAVGGRDRISNLPDGVLQHLLSFLPAQDVVRTCVLAKRCRHLWKSTPALRFVCGGSDAMEPESMEEIQEFVDHLLRLRISAEAALDRCEFHIGDCQDFDMSHITHWIRIALQCKARVLQLSCSGRVPGIPSLDDHPFFISQYLKKLELQDLYDTMPRRFLDFSCCPVLEDLGIDNCSLRGALRISSQSLKRLTIESCYFDHNYRLPICAPNLVSLWLVVLCGRTPSLQRMPSLLTATVNIYGYTYHDCDDFESDDDYSNQSILLQALSEARNLSLVSPHRQEEMEMEMFTIFRRDLKFCSGFNKLKSLVLDEYWCEPADFSALACLLKLCPVLEKLTLQLYWEGPIYGVEIELNCRPVGLSTEISRHLKIVEVKSEVYHWRIGSVLAFLTKQIRVMTLYMNGLSLNQSAGLLSLN